MTDPASRIAYLRSLPSIRDRCGQVFALAESNQLDFWTLDLAKQPEIVDFVCSLIARDYGTDYASIPPHGRWRHFVGDRVAPLLAKWDKENVPTIEVARRMVDLMVSSVLMDAGAGNVWKYEPKEGGEAINRSEGLAVGSLEMFESGVFSGVDGQPYQVDGEHSPTLNHFATTFHANAVHTIVQPLACPRFRLTRSPRRCK